MRYLMTFSYDGTNYYGYQKQANANTIQGLLEKALTKINSNNCVSIHASGRTDSKVHALNQTAHFDLDKEIELNLLKHSLNSILPNDIYVKKIVEVSNDFHARFDIIKKEYIYKINMGEYNPLEVNYVLQYNKTLDLNKIKEAIKLFVGEHDFTSFTKTTDLKDNIRTIYQTNVTLDKNILTITFIGNGFLRYMVRNMVGLLIEIGENKKQISDIENLFIKKNRSLAGITAKPNGLYLKQVYYE